MQSLEWSKNEPAAGPKTPKFSQLVVSVFPASCGDSVITGSTAAAASNIGAGGSEDSKSPLLEHRIVFSSWILWILSLLSSLLLQGGSLLVFGSAVGFFINGTTTSFSSTLAGLLLHRMFGFRTRPGGHSSS